MGNESQAPGIIRAACRSRFYDALDVLSEIAWDDEQRSADRIKAIHELGAFGLGSADQAAVHIHAGEGSQVIGVVHLPMLDEVPAEDASEGDGVEGDGEEPGEVAADELIPPERQLPAG